MTNRSIYETALRLASEIDREGLNGDYLERSKYLLPVVCQRFACQNTLYCLATGQSAPAFPTDATYALDESFPLSDIFLSPAAALLASLLVVEENPTLSERLAAIASAAVEEIQKGIPFASESIRNVYP